MVTVDTALKKGRLQLLWFPWCLMGIGFMLLGLVGEFDVPEGKWARASVVFGGYILTFLLPPFYYLLVLPRWRIWALSNVRNVHELKQRAALRHLYPEKQSLVWRWAIKSARQIALLEELEKKFEQPDIFEDDDAIPPCQIEYFPSKSDKLIFLIFAIASLIASIYFFRERNLFACIIMLPGALLAVIVSIGYFKTNLPLLTISVDGITSQEYGFHAWRDIRNEQVYPTDAGEDSYYGLSYDMNNESFEISLQTLAKKDRLNVDIALRTYRGRLQIEQG
jgi:hypothetical protein